MIVKLNIKTKFNEEKLSMDSQREIVWRIANKLLTLAVAKCPVDTGNMKQHIHLVPNTYGSLNYLLTDGVHYGVHVEFGTQPHEIRARSKKALSFEWTSSGGKKLGKKGRRGAGISKSKSTKAVFKSVMHPGTTEQPFFRPAYDEVKAIWVDRIIKEVLGK